MRLQLLAVVGVSVLCVAACGGGGTSSPAVTPAKVSTPAPVASAAMTAGPSAASTPVASVAAPTTVAPSAGTSSAVPSAAALDLCGLLSAADVHTALGGSWIEGELTSTGGYCHWDSGASPNDRVITAVDPRTLAAVKTASAGGVDFVVGGAAGYTVRDEAANVVTTYLDRGTFTVIVEIPMTSNAADDQANAQALSEVAAGNW